MSHASPHIGVSEFAPAVGTPPGAAATIGWTPLRLLIIGICILINAIDGMDVVMMSYVAPDLTRSWNISTATLGVVFSAGLAGMAFGGLVVSPFADRFGRRPLLIFAVTLMSVCMILSGYATSVTQLVVLRLLVGTGIGTALVAMAALAAEYAPPRHHDFAVATLNGGYPLGATGSGLVVAPLIATHGWSEMLIGAGIISAIMLIPVLFVLPESIAFLSRRQPSGALRRISKIERRLGVDLTPALAPVTPVIANQAGVRGLFVGGRAPATLLLWVSVVLCYTTLYFIISWIPKLAIVAGLSLANSIYAGALYNVGAFFGSASIGLVSMKIKLPYAVALYLLIASIEMVIFGAFSMPLISVLTLAFFIGVFLQGGFNGHYPLAAAIYPPESRGTGLGWATGIGRGGAVAGPLVGGLLLGNHVPLVYIFIIFVIPILACCLCMLGMIRITRTLAARTA